MKKIKLTLFVISSCLIVNAQSYTEDFESFKLSDKVAQNSTHWHGGLGVYSAEKDGIISNTHAHSGKNSMYLNSKKVGGGPADIVLDLGNNYASGVMKVEFWLYIEGQTGGYFSIQGMKDEPKYTNLHCYIRDDLISLRSDSTYNAPLKWDEWQKYTIDFDLNNGLCAISVDDVLVASFKKNFLQNLISGIRFYPLPPAGKTESKMWVDDVSYTYTPENYTSNKYSFKEATSNGERLHGEIANISGILFNESTQDITSVLLNIKYDGSTYHQEINNLSIGSGGVYPIDIFNAFKINGQVPTCEIFITKVNGSVANGITKSAIVELNPIVVPTGKMVLIEEGTGTWCGWCPRGAVTLDRFHDLYGESSTGVAIHYNDPMQAEIYSQHINDHHFAGYPSGKIARGKKTLMFFESTRNLFYEEVLKPPHSVFDVSAKLNADQLLVTVEYQFTDSVTKDWRIGCILVENGVTGGVGYEQFNSYSGGSSGEMGGYENLPNPVPASQMVYNHVARAFVPHPEGDAMFTRAYHKGENDEFTFNINLKEDWDIDSLSLIPVLFRPDSTIDNVDYLSLSDALSSNFESGNTNIYPNPADRELNIKMASQQSATVDIYSMDGRLVKTENISGKKTTLDIESLLSGMYTVIITSDDLLVQKKLFIE